MTEATLRGGRFDSLSTLVALHASFASVQVPIQLNVWPLIASDTNETLWRVPAALVGLGLVSLLAMIAGAYLAPATSERLYRFCLKHIEAYRSKLLLVVIATAITATMIISLLVLQQYPNSADEYSYLFQAERFAEGRLWADAPPLGYTFVAFRTWITGSKWLSQYPPGWPLALAVPIAIGVPAVLLNPVLGGISAACLTSSAWRFPQPARVLVVVAIYVLTPFYLLNAGSFHSHTLSALLIVALCLFCLRFEETGQRGWLVLAGIMLGLVGTTRYFSVPLLCPALIYWLAGLRRIRVSAAAVLFTSALPVLTVILLYHYLALGDPLKTTYSLIGFQDSTLSAAPDDIREGIAMTGYRIVELAIWTAPELVGIYIFSIIGKIIQHRVAFYDLIFPCFVLGFVFFPDLGGNRHGPRYYFDAFPLLLATIMSAKMGELNQNKHPWLRPVLVNVSLACGVYILVALPFSLAAFNAQMVSRQEPFRLAQQLGLRNAIVIIKTPSGLGMAADDLARNDPSLNAPVLYARRSADVDSLHELFPYRSIWAYERPDPMEPGRLGPLHQLGSPTSRQSVPKVLCEL